MFHKSSLNDVNPYCRVVYAFGERIKYQITDITETYLSVGVLDLVKEVDYLARKVLRESGKMCLKIVYRPFCTSVYHVTMGDSRLSRLAKLRTFQTFS